MSCQASLYWRILCLHSLTPVRYLLSLSAGETCWCQPSGRHELRWNESWHMEDTQKTLVIVPMKEFPQPVLFPKHKRETELLSLRSEVSGGWREAEDKKVIWVKSASPILFDELSQSTYLEEKNMYVFRIWVDIWHKSNFLFRSVFKFLLNHVVVNFILAWLKMHEKTFQILWWITQWLGVQAPGRGQASSAMFYGNDCCGTCGR